LLTGPDVEALQQQRVRALIEQLRELGYRVAKADRIRTITAQEAFEVSSLLRHGEDAGFREHIARGLGRAVGERLMGTGAVPVVLEADGIVRRIYRARVDVVVPDPYYDWPAGWPRPEAKT
jgi:hypothetical protein